MTKDSYSKLWTFFALLVLYTSVNMYLAIQGSPMALPYPNFEDLYSELIPLFTLLIFIPSYTVFLLITGYFVKNNITEDYWTKRFPMTFNVKANSYSSPDVKAYQRVSLFLFYILPLLLQIHVIRKLLSNKIFIHEKCNYEPWANNLSSHLFKWPDLGTKYVIGNNKPGEWVDYLPTIQTWLFILIIISFYYFTFKILRQIIYGESKD